MKNNKALIAAIFVIAMAALTAVMFVLLPERNSTFTISYIFTLLALIAGLISSLYLSGASWSRNIPQDIAFLYVAYQYLVAEVIVSIVALFIEYSSSFDIEINSNIYILIHMLLLAFFAVRAILLFMGKKHIDEVGNKAIEKVTNIRMLCADVDALKEKAKELPSPCKEEAIKELEAVHDSIRYSDPMSNEKTKGYDEAIEESIFKLGQALDEVFGDNEHNIEFFKRASSRLQSQIKDRNNRVRLTKGL